VASGAKTKEQEEIIMISQETLKRIKQIEIHTRRMLNGSLIGDTRSAKRGSGFEFDQIREYQQGDDVRFIDWKSSARTNTLLVKEYIEERNRCVIIVLDVSRSGLFTSSATTKYVVMSEIAAILALVAEYGNDSSSLLLFSDDIELFIPPAKGRHHVRMLITHMFEHKLTRKATSFQAALKRLTRMQRKDALIVIISDFIDIQADYEAEKLLRTLTKQVEIVAIRCLDNFEEQAIPEVGFLTVEDIESGEKALLDMRHHSHERIRSFLRERACTQEHLLKKYGIDLLTVTPGIPCMSSLIRFFRQRMAY
jgi:uncharacterized protein (DUF58 family)